MAQVLDDSVFVRAPCETRGTPLPRFRQPRPFAHGECERSEARKALAQRWVAMGTKHVAKDLKGFADKEIRDDGPNPTDPRHLRNLPVEKFDLLQDTRHHRCEALPSVGPGIGDVRANEVCKAKQDVDIAA
jgi:hypothetical protein